MGFTLPSAEEEKIYTIMYKYMYNSEYLNSGRKYRAKCRM